MEEQHADHKALPHLGVTLLQVLIIFTKRLIYEPGSYDREIITMFKLSSARGIMNRRNVAVVVLSVMMMVRMKAFHSLSRSLSLSTDGSSECSPRRRSISGGGASEKSVAVETSSPFKVPVRVTKSVCGCVCVG